MPSATAAGTFVLGGDLDVRRLGFGAMRLTGPGITGRPKDEDTARAVLRRAVELGVNHVDTAVLDESEDGVFNCEILKLPPEPEPEPAPEG